MGQRAWDTGKRLCELTFGTEPESRYGAPYLLAPYLLMHGGDLHAALASAVPPQLIAFNKKLVGLDRKGAGVALRSADGSSAAADAVVGANVCIRSCARCCLGPSSPSSPAAAHRTVFPAVVVDTCTKWWGPDRHIVIYPVHSSADEVYFLTSLPDPDWNVESWSARSETAEVRRALAGFHEDVGRVLDACPGVHKWALVERDPLPRRADGAIVLAGDACHPMTAYMAQGAANALEDAAVLSRCGVAIDDVASAFRSYQATRLERTATRPLTSRQNTSGKQAEDWSWV
jgi:6-hydroxynicotinate 3-monooxygenase